MPLCMGVCLLLHRASRRCHFRLNARCCHGCQMPYDTLHRVCARGRTAVCMYVTVLCSMLVGRIWLSLTPYGVLRIPYSVHRIYSTYIRNTLLLLPLLLLVNALGIVVEFKKKISNLNSFRQYSLNCETSSLMLAFFPKYDRLAVVFIHPPPPRPGIIASSPLPSLMVSYKTYSRQISSKHRHHFPGGIPMQVIPRFRPSVSLPPLFPRQSKETQRCKYGRVFSSYGVIGPRSRNRSATNAPTPSMPIPQSPDPPRKTKKEPAFAAPQMSQPTPCNGHL